jgi:soluble lytic murein transglycosylase-like protein
MLVRIPAGGYAVGLAVALLWGMPSAEAFAEPMYQFVDQDGGIHFSNVPTDPRYKKIRASESRARIRPTNPSQALHETILQTSLLYRLNPALVHAVIRAESAYDPHALSAKGAMGLMQLMPETASLLNVSNPYDPEQNISGGARYLRYLLDRFGGNLELALAAYNAGENRVSRESRVPHISETQQYVRKVLRFYRDFDTAPLVTHRFVNYLSPN